MVNVWPILPISAGIAFVLGFVYMIVLRCCAGVLVWATIFLILAGIIVGAYFTGE